MHTLSSLERTMPADSNTKDSRDRSKPSAPEGAVPDADQRRFRGRHERGGRGNGDDPAREAAEGDTSGDAPMDPPDEEFIESK
jgi:hypothetical protein